MIRSFLPLAALLASPLAAQETPAALPVSYDDAVGCAFIAMGFVMRDDLSPEKKKAAGALGTRYVEYAKSLSGKSTDEVVDDMAAAAKPILAEAQQDARPAKRFDARYADCESKARLF